MTSAVRERVPLAGYTTLGLGGPAARFAEAGSDDEAVAAVRDADRDVEPVLVLGGGSNMVVADEGFPGTVVHMATQGVTARAVSDTVTLTVAAGEDWDRLVERCVADGLSGIECLSGIPGLAGATPIQNVGAYGQEVAQTIVAVRAYDRLRDAVAEIPAAECGFGYRTSAFKRAAAAPSSGSAARSVSRGAGRAVTRGAADPAAATGRFVVLGVTFRLAASPLSAPVRYAELARTLGVAEGDRVPLADARAAVLSLRRGKGMVLDPADPDSRSAGSFFTNPVLDAARFAEVTRRAGDQAVPHFPAEDGQVKVPAAWLIEHAGFGRGYTVGGDPGGGAARISAKHTLALVNPGSASTADLIRLAREIRDGVRQAFGVELTTEPVLVGTAL